MSASFQQKLKDIRQTDLIYFLTMDIVLILEKKIFQRFPKTIEKQYSITLKSYGALTSYKTKILMYFYKSYSYVFFLVKFKNHAKQILFPCRNEWLGKFWHHTVCTLANFLSNVTFESQGDASALLKFCVIRLGDYRWMKFVW